MHHNVLSYTLQPIFTGKNTSGSCPIIANSNLGFDIMSKSPEKGFTRGVMSSEGLPGRLFLFGDKTCCAKVVQDVKGFLISPKQSVAGERLDLSSNGISLVHQKLFVAAYLPRLA